MIALAMSTMHKLSGREPRPGAKLINYKLHLISQAEESLCSADKLWNLSFVFLTCVYHCAHAGKGKEEEERDANIYLLSPSNWFFFLSFLKSLWLVFISIKIFSPTPSSVNPSLEGVSVTHSLLLSSFVSCSASDWVWFIQMIHCLVNVAVISFVILPFAGRDSGLLFSTFW